MTAHAALADLVAWWAGDLAGDEQERVEEHLLGCEDCTALGERVARLAAGVRDLVRAGRVVATVTASTIARAEAEGLKVRSYRIPAGGAVACTAAPDDDAVVIRLQTGAAGAGARLDVEVHGPELPGIPAVQRLEDVLADAGGEIVLLYPGELVRGIPRSSWAYVVTAIAGGEVREAGTYRLDHTPWREREG